MIADSNKEWAGIVSRQMESGSGRHNSNHLFNRRERALIADDVSLREIGYVNNNAIRSKFEDCAIGEYTADASKILPDVPHIRIAQRTQTVVGFSETAREPDTASRMFEELIFEKVLVRGPDTFIRHFWKRIE